MHRALQEVERVLAAALGCVPELPLAAVLAGALGAPGKLLGGEPRPRWPLLPLLCCAAASGNGATHEPDEAWRPAAPGAAAVELLVAAFDLSDDVMDGDTSPLIEEHGAAAVLNAAAALQALAGRALLAQGEEASACPAGTAGAVLAGMALRCCRGQALDLAHESCPTVSVEEALAVAGLKSASLVEGACRLGALLGTDDGAVVDLVARLGHHLGLAAQLANDLHDVEPGPGPYLKSDLRRRKKTVPVAFALAHDPEFAPLLAADSIDAEREACLRQRLWDCGAIHYTALQARVEKERARDLLAEMETRRPGASRYLEVLLE